MSFPVYLAPVLRGLCSGARHTSLTATVIHSPHPPPPFHPHSLPSLPIEPSSPHFLPPSCPTAYLQTVLLLVSHGATVLTGSLPELSGLCPLSDSLVVPLIDAAVLLLLLVLRSLMLETGAAETDVPRSLDNVLGYVGVDVSGGRQRGFYSGCLDTDAHVRILPSFFIYFCWGRSGFPGLFQLFLLPPVFSGQFLSRHSRHGDVLAKLSMSLQTSVYVATVLYVYVT